MPRWDETPLGYRLVLRANRFLYHMVRIVVGTSLEVGVGKRAPESMREVLARENRSLAGPLAPAQGLYLTAVGYDPPWPDDPPVDPGAPPVAALALPEWSRREVEADASESS